MHILVIDDEDSAREALAHELRLLHPDLTIVHAASHAEAVQQLETTAFDVIYTDLLLPPRGVRVQNGHTVTLPSGEMRRFTGDDRRQWVFERGGIDLVHRTRRAIGRAVGPNVRTPIVVMTSFVDTDPYEHITRRLGADDPRVVLLPKLASIDRHDLPSEDLKRSQVGVRDQLREALRLSLRPGWSIAHGSMVRSAADKVRRHHRQMLQKLGIHQARTPSTPTRAYYEPSGQLTCTLRVEIDPGDDIESVIELLGNASDESELSLLYDNWPRLRDWVLLNPAVGVRLWATVELVGEQDASPSEVELTAYESGPGVHHGDPEPAAEKQLARMLTQRMILVYLAALTEAPFGPSETWGVSEGDLPLMARALDGPRPAGDRRWGSTQIPLDCDSLLRDIANGVQLKDLTDELERRLAAATGSRFYRDADAVLQPVTLPGARGWLFNGSLELGLPREEWFQPTGVDQQKVAFFALADEVSFACLDGRLAAADELELRFRDAGMKVERFGELEDAVKVRARLPDATLGVLAPVTDALLSSFVDGSARDKWIAASEAMGEPLPPTILVLEDNVTLRPAAQLEQLQEIGIDCMYPSQSPGALDLTKIMDHVICAGYRTRYDSLHEENADLPETRQAARERFSQAYERAFALGYDGDVMSGAASERFADGLLVTASKTHKLSADSDDVSIVTQVDFVRNHVHWRGMRKPSSSVRWHSLIYRRHPWARCILHTHWKAITYRPEFESCRTSRYRLSGSRLEAAEVVAAMESFDEEAGFAILRDHGEVFVASDWDRLFELVRQVLGRIEC